MAKVHSQDFRLVVKQGLAANVGATATKNLGKQGELAYTTDSEQLHVHNGTEFKQAGLSRTSTSADPTTTEYPNDGDAGIHKNTSSGDVFLAYNDGGSTIVKVQLS